MWEAFMESPLGRVFQRKFVMAFATVIVACFAYIFAAAPVAHAADASWKDDSNITYNGQSYGSGSTGPTSILINNTPASWAKFPGIPHDAPLFINQTIVNGKLEVIYFDPSGDFDTSKPNDYLYSSAAHIITYDYNAATKTPSNPSNPTAIVITARATRAPPTGNTSCSIDGIGWIVCPVTNFLAQAMDYIFGIVQSFLAVQPLSSSTDKPMYLVWDQMRNIANVAFVIGFLILVYGQITGGLVSNYTLKKMVPRIVIAAILVNVSYLICQLAVDLGNILGYSINNIFLSMRDHAVSVSGGNGWGETSWKEVATVLLAGGGAVAIGGIAITSAVVGGGAIFLFIPLLLSVLFVVLMTFLILAARQAIITILIVIAPIAFVAYLLPNTEKWFHKWRDTFVTLLLVFPGFSFIFGGSQLAGSLIIQNASGPNQLVIMILGMAVQVMPLAITPLLLKLGGGVLNRFAGIVNNPTKGLFDKGKNWANERREEAVSRGNARLSGMNSNGTLPRYGFRRMAYRRFASKQEREGEKSANDAMGKAYFSQTAAGQRVSDMNKRAGLEQEYADNRNQARWNNQVRTNSVLRQRSLDSHDAHSRADLYKKNVDAQAEEHWSHTQQTNAAIRAIRTDTHLTEGRAKLAEDAMTNADERQLQTQINGNLALRNLKIGADVDAAHAKLQSDNVAADGKLRFQNEVDNDRALRTLKVGTYLAEQEASSIENRLNSNAKARWDQLSRTDAHLQQLRLQEVHASDSAKRVEGEWNSFIENIRATGSDAPNVTTGNIGIANSIKGVARDIAIESYVQSEAKRKQNENLITDLTNDKSLRKYAGGVGGDEGAIRVQAQALQQVVEEAVKGVKTNRVLTSKLTRDQLKKIMYTGRDQDNNKVTVEMQQAAMYELLQEKGNNHDAQEIRDAVSGMGMYVDEATGEHYEYQRDNEGRVKRNDRGDPLADFTRRIEGDELNNRLDWQQFFDDAMKGSKHSMTTRSGTNQSEYRAGTSVDTIKYAYMRDAITGKFGPEKMFKADIDELKTLLEDIKDPKGEFSRLPPDRQEVAKQAIIDAILGSQRHPTRGPEIDDRNRGVMNQIISQFDPSYAAGVDTNSKPLFYVDPATNAIIKPSDVTPGQEKQFAAQVTIGDPSVSGYVPVHKKKTIEKNW